MVDVYSLGCGAKDDVYLMSELTNVVYWGHLPNPGGPKSSRATVELPQIPQCRKAALFYECGSSNLLSPFKRLFLIECHLQALSRQAENVAWPERVDN